MTVHEAIPVKICQNIQSGLEYLPCLRFGERPMLKNLRQVLLGVFHHDVEQPYVVQPAASHVEEPHQIGVRQLSSQFPPGELQCRASRIFQNESNCDIQVN